MKHKFQFFFLVFVCCFAFVKTASGAGLYVSPGSGSFGVGSTFTVTVRTNTEGQSVNTAEASISYSTDTLELVSVTGSSIFYLQTPGSPSKGNGTAYFGGGVPSPGYNGTDGVVGTMSFRALRQGAATVSVSSGKVLLNDGSGTNALTATAGANFTITPPAVGFPEVVSNTHPNPDLWYAKNAVELSWSRPNGAYGFSFELDQQAETVPDNILDTTITTSKTYTELTDGIWYFHIKARRETGSFGNVQHFRIQVDVSKPEIFEIKLMGQSDPNQVSLPLRIEFESTDSVSDIDHYDIHLDDKFLATLPSNSYIFEKMSAGPHTIKVVAYDKAGNTTAATLPLVVIASSQSVSAWFSGVNFSSPTFLLVVLNIVMLALIVTLFWKVARLKRREEPADREQLKALRQEIDKSLDTLKRRIDRQLNEVAEKSSAEKLSKLTLRLMRGKTEMSNKINRFTKKK